MFKRFFICYVVHNEGADATSEVAAGHRPVLLLSGRVPYLQFDDFVINSEVFLTEFDTNSVLWIMINFRIKHIYLY